MKIITTSLFLLFTLSTFAADYSIEDYSEAMRMTVKFFGAQRCGDTHNWLLHDNPNNGDVCHTQDSYQGHDVTGGWHDCGDHIKVATTMGYAAICLLSAYDIWPKAFEDLHDSAYVEKPNSIADILDEVKIATDYFMKCLINGNTFVYYVGNDKDHDRWVTSSFQSTLGPDLGGDPRPVSASSDNGGAQAADYASALALMAMHYPDSAYADKCKKTAIEMYKFAKDHPSNISIPTFYSSPNSETSDELSLASILMYRLTNDTTFKTEAFGYLQGKWESNSPLAWDTKADIAYYYLIKEDTSAGNGNEGVTIKSFLKKNVSQAINGVNSYGIPWNWFKSNWGSNKLACGTAFSAALYAKLIEDDVISPIDGLSAETATNFNKKIIGYMLGTNEINHPYIHGFKGDMYCKVHHRNAMGRDDNPPSEIKNSADFMFGCGALIGGPTSSDGAFHNKVEDGNLFMETESGCDYNGPFVAALANIVAHLDPKEVTSVHYTSRPNKFIGQRISKQWQVYDICGRKVSNNGKLYKSAPSAPQLYIITGAGKTKALSKLIVSH